MQYRQLGRTDLLVSALSLGTVALGMPYGITPRNQQGTDQKAGMPPPSDADVIYLIHQALDSGINFIDTARGYGRSENLLGEALQDRRDKVVLTTKIGSQNADGEILRGPDLRQHMQDSITTSLRLLRTDRVDLLMLHSASVDILQRGEAIGILKDFQAQGLTRFIGASTYGAEAPRLAILDGVHALQVAYNILDQRMSNEIFPLAEAEGVGMVVRSVFLKGVLTPRVDDLPPHLAALKEQVTQIQRFAAQLTPPLSLVEVALRFALSHSSIASVLVGIHSVSELETALGFAEAGALFAPDLNELEQMRWDANPEMLDPSTWGIP